MVALAQQVDDLLLDGDQQGWLGGLDHEIAQGGHALDALHGAGVGDDDQVVLVLALDRQSFGGEHAHDDKGDVLDTQDPAQGVFAWEQADRQWSCR